MKALHYCISGLVLGMTSGLAVADQVFLDDIIVDGSACIGFDCVNGEAFGFDTLRLKENNLRIKAQDTSTSASFPTNDWQITFNDTSNGGANKFSIDDVDGGRTPFTIEAGAPTNSLYVEDGGRVGFGTSTPVVDLHVVSGNTPTLRLEQDGSSGFTAQTWDLAGNETNFFIRDATNGSALPFRIQPGADSNVIYIANDDDIGLGDTSPDAELDLENGQFFIDNNSGAKVPRIKFQNGTYTNPDSTAFDWFVDVNNAGGFRISREGSGQTELELSAAGSLVIGGTTMTVPDYVFKPDYSLMPMSELAAFVERENHLPNVPSAAEVKKKGLNITQMQLALLEKVEELTLYTLRQEEAILRQEKEIRSLREQISQQEKN